MSAGIVDLASKHEGRLVTNDEFDAIGLTHEWIMRRSGIESRRWLPADQSLAPIAAKVCAKLVSRMESPDSLGALVLVNTSEKQRIPGLAPLVAHLAGLPQDIVAFDLNSACTGFVTGLSVALAMCDSGQVTTALVCTAEAMSRLINPQDRSSAFLFGDGVAAVRVESRPHFSPSYSIGGVDGSQTDLMTEGKDGIELHGVEVYDRAVLRMSEMARQLEATNPALDVVIGHQANGRILQSVAANLTSFSATVINKITRFGNTSSASIPLALDLALAEGDIPTSGRLGAVAYGAGESWAGTAVNYDLPTFATSHTELGMGVSG